MEMTVKELIERLKRYNWDEKVTISLRKDEETDVKDVWRAWNEDDEENYNRIIISNY